MPHGTWEHCPGSPFLFTYRAITFYGSAFQRIRLRKGFITSRDLCRGLRQCPTTLQEQHRHVLTLLEFGLFPFRSPLLGESLSVSFPPPTEMFHFGGLASRLRRQDDSLLRESGFPIRESRDHRLLAPPPGLSQLATPFIA